MYSYKMFKVSFILLFVVIVLFILFQSHRNRTGCKLYNKDQFEFACNGSVTFKNEERYLDSMPEIVIQGSNESWSYRSYDHEGLIPKTQIGDSIVKIRGTYLFNVYRGGGLYLVFNSEKDCN